MNKSNIQLHRNHNYYLFAASKSILQNTFNLSIFAYFDDLKPFAERKRKFFNICDVRRNFKALNWRLTESSSISTDLKQMQPAKASLQILVSFEGTENLVIEENAKAFDSIT